MFLAWLVLAVIPGGIAIGAAIIGNLSVAAGDDTDAAPDDGDEMDDSTPATPATAATPATGTNGLRSDAAAAWSELKRVRPNVIGTSFVRDRSNQARVDAGNTFRDSTYLKIHRGAVKDRLQSALDSLPTPRTQNDIQSAFTTIMIAATDDELSHYSAHLSGDAFDCSPHQPRDILECLTKLCDQHIAAGGHGVVLVPPRDPAWHIQLTGNVGTSFTLQDMVVS